MDHAYGFPHVRLFVCVATGAVINVGMAWACAVYGSDELAPSGPGRLVPEHWPGPVPDKWGATPLEDDWGKGRSGPRFDRHEAMSVYCFGHSAEMVTAGSFFFSRTYEMHSFGLPFRSMRRDEWNTFDYASQPGWMSTPASGLRGGLAIKRPLPGAPWFILERYRLPVVPVASGTIANTAIFSAPVWLCIAGVRSLRRSHRRRRGRCGECSYPIGVSPVCTECGQPVQRQDPARTAHA